MKPECLLDEAENCENPDAHLLSPALRFDGILNYFEFAKSTTLGCEATRSGAQPDAALVLHGALQPLAFRPSRQP